MQRGLLMFLLLAAGLCTGCAKRESRGGDNKPPPAPANEMRGKEIIVRRPPSEIVLEPKSEPKDIAFMVFSLTAPARFNYDGKLQLADYTEYQKTRPEDRKATWSPFVSVVTPETREKFDELYKRMAESEEPIPIRLIYRHCRVKHYTESGFKMGLPGGASTEPIVIDDIEFY